MFSWLISCLHVTQLAPKERWKSYINVKWDYLAAGHLEIKSAITNTEVDCKLPAGIHPRLRSTATIRWWQVVIRIKYLDRNLLLTYYSAKCSMLNLEWKIELRRAKKIGRGLEQLLHGSAAAAAEALCMLKAARAAPPSFQGSRGCRWVVENKLPAQSPDLSTQAACWGSPWPTYCPGSQGGGCKASQAPRINLGMG